jgi:hypothetical protein
MDDADIVEEAEAPAAEQGETSAREPVETRQRRVNLDTLFWAGILVWTGAVLLASNFGYLDWFTYQGGRLAWHLPFRASAWRLVFLGVAVIVGAEIAVHLLVPKYRRNVLGYLILVIVFASLGVGYVNVIWPAILIVVGIALMMRSRRRRRGG